MSSILLNLQTLISVTAALPALTDNGVISSIASVLKNKPKKALMIREETSSDTTAVEDAERLNRIFTSRVYIDVLIVQILDTAITNHTGSFTVFKEQGGAEAALLRLLSEIEILSTQCSLPILTSSSSNQELQESESEGIDIEGGVKGQEELSVLTDSLVTATLTLTSLEAVAAVQEGARWVMNSLPPANKVLLHQLIVLTISWVEFTQQDSGDHIHAQLLKGPSFARIFGVLFNNVNMMTAALISPALTMLADIIHNDPAPPGLLGHMVTMCYIINAIYISLTNVVITMIEINFLVFADVISNQPRMIICLIQDDLLILLLSALYVLS
jgi:hypothetical protein